jgi:ligand-binding sensor domain-containing protein
MRTIIFLCLLVPLLLCGQESNQWRLFYEGAEIRQVLLNVNSKWIGTCSEFGIIEMSQGIENAKYFVQDNSELPSKCICDLTEDKRGNIWAGFCYGGFAKYNGSFWSVYEKDNSKLPGRGIQVIKVSRENILWLGTTRDGLVSIFDNRWVFYDTLNSPLPGNLITSLVFDKNQKIWIGTWNGVCCFDGLKWKIYNTANSWLPGNEILSLEIDKNNNIWAGTYEDGVGRFNGISWISYTYDDAQLLSNPINCIKAGDGEIWFGTASAQINDSIRKSGLLRFDGTNWYEIIPQKPIIHGVDIECIEIDHNNNVWIGTKNGLAVYNENGICLE